jgi:hypothetical protein
MVAIIVALDCRSAQELLAKDTKDVSWFLHSL